MGRNIKILVYSLFILLVASFVIVGGSYVKQKFGELPFFPKDELRITGTGWNISYLQPVYLSDFSRDGKYFLKTFYFDSNGKFHLLDVFVGGDLNGKEIKLAQYRPLGNEVIKNKIGGDYGYPFRFGQRIRIEYLSEIDDYETYIDSDICRELEDLCHIVNFMYEKEEYSSFSDSQRLDKEKSLPAVQIHEEIIQ